MGLIKKRNELDVNVRLKMLIFGQAGMGKSQPLFSNVLTPKGFKPMGCIKVGEEVLSADGNAQTVEGVYPQGVRPYYRITTNDGCECFCDIEHVWTVRNSTGNSRKAGWRNMTLAQMIEKGITCPMSPSALVHGRKPTPRFEIPVGKMFAFTEKELPIDPYILGVLIGDGTLVGSVVAFSNPEFDKFIKQKVEERLPEGYILTKHEGGCPQYVIAQKNSGEKQGFKKKVSALGLDVHSGDKFIPKEYLISSVGQRLQLLHGLMDTDGYCIKNRTVYSTSSGKLAQDVVELVRSLGGTATINYYVREDRDSKEYRVRIRMAECPFSLERKAKEWNPIEPSRYIVSAEKIGYTECQCIKVSNDDELYITDDYIVTHNTTLALSAPKPLLLDADGGINRVDYEFIKDTVQVERYEDVLDLLNNEDLSDYETIVIDTGGKLLDLMADYIIRLYPRMAKRNGSLTLEGFGQRKREFSALLKLIDSKKKNVVFVAHRQTEKNGDAIRYVPLFGGSNYDSLATELDLIGYLVADERRRTITFDPTSESEGKNTCNMPSVVELPNLKDAKGNVCKENNFLKEKVFKAYRERLIERSAEGESYKKLIDQITDDIMLIDSVEGANNFKDNVATGYEHIGNSLAIARQKFMAHVDKLGFVYNKEKKVYEQQNQQTAE